MLARTNTTSLADILEDHAAVIPDKLAYIYLRDGETEQNAVTFLELSRQVRSLAVSLQSMSHIGDRALLVYNPGVDFIVAFLACIYSGVIPVPVPAFKQGRHSRVNQRADAIIADAKPAFIMTESAIADRIASREISSSVLASIPTIISDILPESLFEDWKHPRLPSESIAFLQYTSGSTGDPKGIMVCHENILENLHYLDIGFHHQETIRFVNWLPHFHDLGLIFGILFPLYSGASCYLMSPFAFAQRPIRWLEAISYYRATHSAGPNFAFQICAEKVNENELDRLDLSCWQTALNGGEYIQNSTLDFFAKTFQSCGFRKNALCPSYGLAETTLTITMSDPRDSIHSTVVDKEQLKLGNVLICDPQSTLAQVVVSCGKLSTTDVRIVDPESLILTSANRIGEIWARGRNVTLGYWQRPNDTEDLFLAKIFDGDGLTYFRTGDLGYIYEGNLYPCGRLKDLVIIRGQNYYPQDIEWAAYQSHDALKGLSGAAFSIGSNPEQLVIVHELSRNYRGRIEPVATSIIKSVALDLEISVDVVVFVKQGTIPKTSSGKIQRKICSQNYASGSLSVVGQYARTEMSQSSFLEAEEASSLLAADKETPPILWRNLRQLISETIKVPLTAIVLNQSLPRLGIDSIAATELGYCIQAKWGVILPLDFIIGDQPISNLADRITSLLEISGCNSFDNEVLKCTPNMYRLSIEQEGLLAEYCLSPSSPNYNLNLVLDLPAIDIERLEQAYSRLLAIHPALCSRFNIGVNGSASLIDRSRVGPVRCVQLSDQDPIDVELDQEAHRPFDLMTGPLIRLSCYNLGRSRSMLQIVAHHIVTDLWSMAVIMRDLGVLYTQGELPRALMPVLTYGAFVQQQAHYLASKQNEADRIYWQRILRSCDLTPRENMSDLSRNRHGGSVQLAVDNYLKSELMEAARSTGVTLQTLLHTAFHLLIYKDSCTDSVLTGLPINRRGELGYRNVVGYFINVVPILTFPARDRTIADSLRQMSMARADAIAHGAYPFPLIQHEYNTYVKGRRDTSLLNIMFVYDQDPFVEASGISGFVNNCSTSVLKFGDMIAYPHCVDQKITRRNLTLLIANTEDGLTLRFVYRTGAVSVEKIDHLLCAYINLLRAIVNDRNAIISRILSQL